jgi:hypothetical protein
LEFSLRGQNSSRLALHKFDVTERGTAATHTSSDYAFDSFDVLGRDRKRRTMNIQQIFNMLPIASAVTYHVLSSPDPNP